MKAHAKRIMALVLTFALVIAIPFAFTQEASAASKKTKYVVTKETITGTDENGNPTTSVYTYEYTKNGLVKAQSGPYGKDVYTYNKKGYQTTYAYYNEKGVLEESGTFTYKYNKKGLPTTRYTYGANKQLVATNVYTYYKNGKRKSSSYTSADNKYTNTYKFNKKGDVTYSSIKNDDYSSVSTLTYKYDKKGNPVSVISKGSWKDNTGSGSNDSTTTYKYTYDKKKNIKKAVETYTYKSSSGSTYSYTTTSTYNYKKVKVPKSFLKFFR